MPLSPLQTLDISRFNSAAVLTALIGATRQLAELKGVAASMPNPEILIRTLGIQEAKESSEIENIVTTHDELFRDAEMPDSSSTAAVKEVSRYGHALRAGYELVRQTGLLTNNHIVDIQSRLEINEAGYRKLPGTTLKNFATGRVIYTPPSPELVPDLMKDLERFINESSIRIDALVKMALIHHQFESIHPFYDGNGRTGRIVNVLYLVKEGLLDLPILYLSRAIMRTKSEYYRLLQIVRERDAWEEWVIYILNCVEDTAGDGIQTINGIKTLLIDYKHRIRSKHAFYSQDLINNLFSHPYTKIEFVMKDLDVTRTTATRYLDLLANDGFLLKQKFGRQNYYINAPLVDILTKNSTSM